MVENFHRGAAVVVDRNGEIVAAYGNINRPIYPRSAIKPLQAMVFAQSGAMRRFNLSHQHLALACASHSGQDVHVDAVRSWLIQVGLNESALKCGAHEARHDATRRFMIQQGQEANALHNNCSGKHAGMITVAVYNDLPIEDYTARSHPVQQRVLKTLSELTNEPVENRPAGLDGCGIPVVGISLEGIALGFARIANGQFDSNSRRDAADKIRTAMKQFPLLVGGDDRFCTLIPGLTSRKVLVKAGAQGVYAGMTVNSNRLGFALKIDDGSGLAAEVAMGWLITKYANLSDEEILSLKPWFEPSLRTIAKKPAGVILPYFR